MKHLQIIILKKGEKKSLSLSQILHELIENCPVLLPIFDQAPQYSHSDMWTTFFKNHTSFSIIKKNVAYDTWYSEK